MVVISTMGYLALALLSSNARSRAKENTFAFDVRGRQALVKLALVPEPYVGSVLC
jgi:hypothetical protein